MSSLKGYIVIGTVIFLTGLVSCGSSCEFDNADQAFDCMCNMSEKIEKAKGQTADLESVAKYYKEAFEKAIEDGNFTVDEVVDRLNANCPSFSKTQ